MGAVILKLVLSQQMAPPHGNRKAKNVRSTSLVERVTTMYSWALVAMTADGIRFLIGWLKQKKCNVLIGA
jgi:hypothetical protein